MMTRSLLFDSVMKWRLLVSTTFTVITMISAQSDVYTGSVPCPTDNTLMGYNNLTILNRDIFAHFNLTLEDGAEKIKYDYIICPNTTYTIDDFGKTIIPATDSSNFYCGQNGRVENNCVIKGGDFQVYFLDILPLEDVVFRGFTFEGANTASVYGDAHPTSLVYFYNCIWRNSCGVSVAYVHFTPYVPTRRRRRLTEGSDRLEFERPPEVEKFEVALGRKPGAFANQRRTQEDTRFSMGVIFSRSLFQANSCRDAVILNIGGEVAISNTKFEDNTADELAVFSTILNGHAFIGAGSSFVSNDANLGPVFISSNSFLQYSENSFGFGNTGGTCSNIFIEDDEANCVLPDESVGDVCTGSCCAFDDTSCDLHPDMTPSPVSSFSDSGDSPNSSPTDLDNQAMVDALNQQNTNDSSEGGCTGFCLAFAIVFPLFALMILGGVFIFVRNRRIRKSTEKETNIAKATERDGRPAFVRTIS
jgi:hypothetical protein